MQQGESLKAYTALLRRLSNSPALVEGIMEAQKSSGFGCLQAFVIALAVFAIALVLCWNIPIGKTKEGYSILVSDYVKAVPPTLLGTPLDTKPAAASDSNAQGAVIDANLFDELKPGITTYDLIQKYVTPRELQSSSKFGNVETDSYVWHNPDGSEVFLMFQNGILASKSQHGLQ